jgi:7-cyano-7-deazaguanine synthase
MSAAVEKSGVCLVSGGLDSMTLLNKLRYENPNMNLHALSFIYGQRHKSKELFYAKYWTRKLHIPYTIHLLKSLGDITRGVSAMIAESSIQPPDKEYDPNEEPLTYVPFRNAIFATLAASYAESNGLNTIYYAGHAGDAGSNYWDCTKAYVENINKLFAMRGISYEAPFIDITKDQICLEGKKIPGFDHSKTWSCYKGGKIHCGTCSTCLERQQSFITSGVIDKTKYETPLKKPVF